MYPIQGGIPSPVVSHLPDEFIDMMKGRDIWRVEWFYNGKYSAQSSVKYIEKYNLSALRGACKLVRISDTVGFCKWESAIRLWFESLYRPDTVVFYEGDAFIFGNKEGIVQQKLRMISHIYDYNNVVTLSVVTIKEA